VETLEEKIKKFLYVGSGYGDGNGYGDGDGDGYGDGSGDGYGYGNDNGYGYGNGWGYGNGDGDGSGYGDGSGDWNGSGWARGETLSNEIKSINDRDLHMIDGIHTIIESVRGNIAKGKIFHIDLTTEDCYIVKQNNLFAHGATLKQAQKALIDKVLVNLPIEDRIKEFKARFKPDKKYKGELFFLWHYRLTGSCEMGRHTFVKQHGINLDDEFTVSEFVDKVKYSYGGEIIKKLMEEE